MARHFTMAEPFWAHVRPGLHLSSTDATASWQKRARISDGGQRTDRSQAKCRRYIRAIQPILLIERQYPVWNLHLLPTIGRLRGGFSVRQWCYCSHRWASAYVGGQNLLMSDVIYHYPHLTMTMAVTGILQLVDKWNSKLTVSMIAKDIDMLDAYTPRERHPLRA